MQAYNHGENWTNEMENMLASDVPLDPDWGFGGAEAGTSKYAPGSIGASVPAGREAPLYALWAIRFTDPAPGPRPQPGHLEQAPLAHANNEGYDNWQHGYYDNLSQSRANHEHDQRHLDFWSNDNPYLGLSRLPDSESLDFQDFSGVLNVGNNDIEYSMWPSNQIGSARFLEPVMGPGFAPAPSFNAGFATQIQYPADFSGQWMMNLAHYIGGCSNYGPLFPPGYLNAQSQVPSQLQATVPAPAVAQVATSFACTEASCPATFSRGTDRIRHETSVHGINGGLHFCHVQGCPKSQGMGYKRRDKLTEHMWKKHADLGYVKRI
ncbi:hypothetical protein EG329_008724 [Mollisiaceae sp. DMI_Dod_QoI]|nr:hypothetical protein EG329_008724 [Helotiales sp. DMI_Dod_QoI]